MTIETRIEWADHTVNFWWGCYKKSPGCAGCYAEAKAKSVGDDIWGEDKPRRLIYDVGEKLRKIEKLAIEQGRKQLVFSNSMSDLFDDDNGAGLVGPQGKMIKPGDWPVTMTSARRRAFNMIDESTNIFWLLLTKSPENILKHWQWPPITGGARPVKRPRVALGTSIENQEMLEQRLPDLLRAKALGLVDYVFVSAEPLLGPLDFSAYFGDDRWLRVDEIIAGGESGRGHVATRPMHNVWAQDLRDACQAAGVAFFFKQWGDYIPGSQVGDLATDDELTTRPCRWVDAEVTLGDDRVVSRAYCFYLGKKKTGRRLDGREYIGPRPYPLQLEAAR